MEHHEASIAAFVERSTRERRFEAVIVSGSVARGTERPDSDVDLYLVVDDSEFAAARAEGRLSYVTSDDVTYEDGYFDIKLVTPDYLRRAALDGDDPCRASFEGARVAWSTIDDLGEQIRRIVELPDAAWVEKQRAFIAHARLQAGYFLPQAHERGDDFLLQHAAVHVVLAYGRALLALNRVLFKAPKYLMRTVAGLPRKPDRYDELAHTALTRPGPDSSGALALAVEGFHQWPVSAEETLSRYVEDNELSWFTGVLPPEYR